MRVGLWRKLSTEELMLLNCGVGETLESPLNCKEIQPVHPKGDQSWVFIGRTDAEAETSVLWPPHAINSLSRVDSLEKTLMMGGTGGRRRRGRQRMRWLDGTMDSMDMSLSKLQEWWWTGRPGVLWFMGSQRVGHNWATELTELTDWQLGLCWANSACSKPALQKPLAFPVKCSSAYQQPNGNPLQYSRLGNPMDRVTSRLHTVHGVTESGTQLSRQATATCIGTFTQEPFLLRLNAWPHPSNYLWIAPLESVS